VSQRRSDDGLAIEDEHGLDFLREANTSIIKKPDSSASLDNPLGSGKSCDDGTCRACTNDDVVVFQTLATAVSCQLPGVRVVMCRRSAVANDQSTLAQEISALRNS